jgi:hypothetical protein
VDRVALGQIFYEYFGFPCQLSFHRLLHIHHLSFGAGTAGQIVADVPSRLSLTPPKKKKRTQFVEIRLIMRSKWEDPDYLSIYLWLYSPCGPWPLFQLLNLYTVGRTPWMGDQPVARPLPTHIPTQAQNKRTQTAMPRVGLEPTIPVFERAKTVHTLDRAATVMGSQTV